MSFTVDPAIIREITVVIREAVAEDWIQDFEIGADTSFNDDLELESIEFVTIAAGLQRHFGEQVNLIGWLSTKAFDELIALRVGNIAEFVSNSLVAGARHS
jgi:acyl carrier protein